MRSVRSLAGLGGSLGVLCVLCGSLRADPLPGTQPLTADGDLARKMVDGLHAYLDRETAASPERRGQFWKPDFTSAAAYSKSVAPNRERLRKLLGVVDDRLPPRMEYVGGPDEPSLVADTDRYTVHAVRWAVLPGVDGEGLLLEPKAKAVANVVALPDADATPEEMVGLAGNAMPAAQFARHLAENGCRVVVPVLIDRKDTWSGSERLKKFTNQPHREYVYRMAFEMGRTLAGYEVQKVLAAVDWFQGRKVDGKPLPVGVSGRGEGALIALYAAALDERIATAAVSGAFGPPNQPADLPIYRNVWGGHAEFGDADILRLIFPRPVSTELIPFTADGPPEPRPGRAGAAPGAVVGADRKAAVEEITRVGRPLGEACRFPRLRSQMEFGVSLTGGDGKPTQSSDAQRVGPILTLKPFLGFLYGTDQGDAVKPVEAGKPPADARKTFDPTARQKRQFDQLVSHVQKLWRDSEHVRKALFAQCDASSPEAWDKSCDALREFFHTEIIGRLPAPTLPPNPRTRRVYDEPTWAGYEVTLDLHPDVFAYGILLLPKDLKPDEKRPVVVCQHGLDGTPRKVIDPEANRQVYNQFARKLVEKGYIVYAPQNPYIGDVYFRQVQRKANPLKLSLYSFIIAQHKVTLDWLEKLPGVDPKRIGFYGLSYGGKTAMRVPAVEKRYCLSICSGDFNEWIGKIVSVDLPMSYMFTKEYEIGEFDLGHTFNYAEMAYLIAPRPFMVERGHDDGVGRDEWVASEYAKVRYLYANRLKVPDRTAIEFFAGGHQINAKGTFEFLERHLGPPVKR